MIAQPPVSSPFKFLDAYTAADQSRFFGRSAEQKRLVELLFRSRLVLVYGPSGTGKTSLVQCGLAQAIPASDYFAIPIRRRGDLRQTLVTTLTNILEETARTEPIELIVDCIRYTLRPVYLIFDQLEELFISGSPEEQNWLAGFLKTVAQSSLACKIILVIREDFLAYLYGYEDALPGLFDFRMRVEPMSGRNLQEVIIGTFSQIEDVRLVDEPKTVGLIIENNRSSTNTFQLPYLQVYLDRLWRLENEKAPEPPVWITPELVEEVGRIDDVLEVFLAEQKKFITDQLQPDEQPAVARVLETFVTYEGTRREHRLGSLEEATRLPVALLVRILTELERTRLVRREDDTYELAHDSLARVIDKGRSAEQRQINEIIRQLKDAYREYTEKGQAEDLLLSLRRLSEIQLHEKAVREELNRSLNPAESRANWQFIEASRAFHEREQRRELEEQRQKNARLKRTVAFVSVLLAVALGAVWLAVSQWDKTNRTRIVLQADQMDPLQALVTVALAYEQDPNDLNRKALFEHFYNHRLYASKIELDSTTIRTVGFSNDGRHILLVAEDNGVYRWNPDQPEPPQKEFYIPGRYLWVELSDDQRHVVALVEPGKLYFGDLETRQIKQIGTDSTITTVSISPDGQSVLTTNEEGRVAIWNAAGSKSERLEALSPVALAGFSPDGRLLLTVPAGVEKKITIWDQRGKTQLDSLMMPDAVLAAEMSPDGSILIIATKNGRVFRWDRNTRILHPLQLLNKNFLFPEMTISNDGKRMAAGVGKVIYWWDATGKLVDTMAYERRIRTVELAPDGQTTLVLVDMDVELWDSHNHFKGKLSHSAAVSSAVFSPDGKAILTHTEDGRGFLWKLEDERLVELIHPETIRDFDVSPDETWMATLTDASRVLVWDRAGKPVDSLNAPPNLSRILVADGARTIFLSDWKRAVSAWDRTNRRLVTLAGEFMAFSADRRTLLTRTETGGGIFWDANGRRMDSLPIHLTEKRAFLSDDGNGVLLFSRDGLVSFWSRKDRKEIELPGKQAAAALGPDGASIIGLTAGANDVLSVWSQQGQPVASYPLKTGRLSEGYRLSAFGVSPSGDQVLMVQGGENQVFVWSRKTGTFRLLNHNRPVERAEFAPDGSFITTLQSEGQSIWWSPDGQRLLEWIGPVGKYAVLKDGSAYCTVQGNRVSIYPGPNAILAWLNRHIPAARRRRILAEVRQEYGLQTSFWEAIWHPFRE
ncbi:NACHT and WD repeat domain-containing protein [Larkinella bovis]|uniref:NACHT and WD repeat domain-containing protein n=1 Tax=Larkinella bovis TaxID=683041 RepID=A0ABW0I977_9BACT